MKEMKATSDESNIFIHYDSTFVRLKKESLEDVNMDEVSKIDYSNLYGEIVTVPALVNRLGNLKAEVEAEVKLSKLDLEVFEAEKRSYYERKFVEDGVKATVQKLSDTITLDKEVQKKRFDMIQIEKSYAYVSSLFFAVKDKSDKLNNLLLPTTPEEFVENIVEGKLNTFIIFK